MTSEQTVFTKVKKAKKAKIATCNYSVRVVGLLHDFSLTANCMRIKDKLAPRVWMRVGFFGWGVCLGMAKGLFGMRTSPWNAWIKSGYCFARL